MLINNFLELIIRDTSLVLKAPSLHYLSDIAAILVCSSYFLEYAFKSCCRHFCFLLFEGGVLLGMSSFLAQKLLVFAYLLLIAAELSEITG